MLGVAQIHYWDIKWYRDSKITGMRHSVLNAQQLVTSASVLAKMVLASANIKSV
uniref:Uncharacterized protein n=1 Tax=Romanomermis culicivorax TaxID=13658 RepID=A0A915IJX6_ROMCU